MTGWSATSGGPTAFLFPGQGSQRVGMADRWLEHPASEDVLLQAATVLGRDPVELCRDADALARTDVAQPALFVCGVAAWRVLAAEGIRPDVVAGHSLGEWTALVAAGVYPFDATLEAVVERGAAMAAAAAERPGAMTAVIGPDAPALADAAVRAEQAARASTASGDVLTVANSNGPRQVVLSGSVPAVERAEALVDAGGGRTRRLAVAGAFHSPLMATAAGRVGSVLDELTPAPPDPWVVPNVTGRRSRDPDLLVRLLRRHLLAPVRWADTVTELRDLGVSQVVECGPRPVLTGLTRPTLPDTTFHWVANPEAACRVALDPPAVRREPELETIT
ncbi:MAG: ACP S-malonyltransferase [Acidimicrobiales bacterium]